MFKDLALIFELMFNKRKDYLMLLKYSCPKKKKNFYHGCVYSIRLKYVLIHDGRLLLKNQFNIKFC